MPTGKEFYSFPYAKISVKLKSGSGKEFYSFPVANRGAGRNGNSFPLGHTTELYKNVTTTLILREIRFPNCREPKTAILAILKVLNFEIWQNSTFESGKIS